MAIFIWEKIDFGAANIIKVKEGPLNDDKSIHYTEDIGMINIYVSHNQASNTWIKLQKETNRSTIILRYFNSLLSKTEKMWKENHWSYVKPDDAIHWLDETDT